MKQLIQRIGAQSIITAAKWAVTDERIKTILVIADAMEEFGITDPRHQAYIMATVGHECSFRCIPEIRARKGTAVWNMQEKYWHTGFYGRGYCQLTWDYNYRKFGALLNINLVQKPELALDPRISARILVIGMRDGLFTGKSLYHYINAEKCDYLNARRIVNGTFMADKVETIANRLAVLFSPS